MRNVYFIDSKHAVTKIYAGRFAQALAPDYEVVRNRSWNILRAEAGVVVITKRFSSRNYLMKLKERGHRIIYICADVFCARPRNLQRRFEANTDLFDHIIFPNQATFRDFCKDPEKSSILIEVSQDAGRINPYDGNWDEPRLAYFGNPQNRPSRIRSLSPCLRRAIACYYRHAEFLRHSHAFNIHVSLRRSATEVVYKPSPKILNAAYAGAIVLIQKGHLAEMFGPDYPFYLEDNPDLDTLRRRFSDRNALDRARETMARIRERFSAERSTLKIREIVSTVVG